MMKKMICAAAALMLLTLSGCGLKGPLYFPPAETTGAKTAPAAKPDKTPVAQQQQQQPQTPATTRAN